VNFAAFVGWKAQVKRDRPQVVDRSETRIATAFAHVRPAPSASSSPEHVHRCDLARTWCRVRGLPDAFAGRALVSEGVRHGLRTIFRVLAATGQAVAIPSDVYPVYWQIAAEAGVAAVPCDTFPRFDVESVLSGVAASGASVALLPCPLKLHGRAWTLAEAASARRWLTERSDRRLILDGVYSFGRRIDDVTRSLLDTAGVLYLDSLSKGWLHEHVFGAAIVPADDVELYQDAFRRQVPRQSQLALARHLLDAHANFPRQLDVALATARAGLLETLTGAGLTCDPPQNGYFAVVERSAEQVLDRCGLLTIPVSVFGAPDVQESPRCLASALPIPRGA
jgi:aspartate/methionine/tyrosine aminotransferase